MKFETRIEEVTTYELSLSKEEAVVIASLLGKVSREGRFGAVTWRLWEEGFNEFTSDPDYVFKLKNLGGDDIYAITPA